MARDGWSYEDWIWRGTNCFCKRIHAEMSVEEHFSLNYYVQNIRNFSGAPIPPPPPPDLLRSVGASNSNGPTSPAVRLPHLDPTTATSMERISKEIAAIPDGSTKHSVVFQVQWSLDAYLQQRLGCSSSEFSQRQPEIYDALRHSPVFTGTSEHFRVTTSERFLRSQWQDFTQKWDMFQLLSNALAAKHRYKFLTECFTCSPLIRHGIEDWILDHWSFLVEAKSSDLVAFAQQLAWLTAFLSDYVKTYLQGHSDISFAKNREGRNEFRLAPSSQTPFLHLSSVNYPIVYRSISPIMGHPFVEMKIDPIFLFAFGKILQYHYPETTRTISPKETLDLQIMVDSAQGEHSQSWALFALDDPKKYLEVLSSFSEFYWGNGLENGRLNPHLSHLRFAVYWDFYQYCNKNLSGRKEISRVPILVGRSGDAFAATCGDYFRQTWPYQAKELLNFFENKFEKDKMTRFRDRDLQARFSKMREDTSKKTYFMVNVTGPPDQVLSLVQQLAFLCASFRPVEEDANVPNQSRQPRAIAANLRLPPDKIESGLGCIFAIDTTSPRELLGPTEKKDLAGRKPCWHYIFPGLNLVHGFPIPPREEEKGVELPLDLMLGLSRVWYSLDCYGTTVLTGYSTVLVPVTRTKTSVQWHLLHAQDSQSRLEARVIEKYCYENIKDSVRVKQDELGRMKARHFLGLWKEVNIHLGTLDSGYESLTESEARNEPKNPTVAVDGTFQFSLSHGVTVNISGEYLLPSSLAFPSDEVEIGISDMIDESYRNASIIYDERVDMGYLVPELSLIYHCILARAAAQSVIQDRRAQVLDKIPKLDPSPDGARVAADKLRAYGELEIGPNFPTDDAYTLSAAFKQVWKHFQMRKREVDLRMEQELRRLRTDSLPLVDNQLLCWNLYDVVTDRRSPSRRQIRLNPTSGRWYEIARDNTDVLIFIYRHIGEDRYMPIRPSRQVAELCDNWTPNNLMTQRSGYLLASIRCISCITRPKSGRFNISSHHFCGRYSDNKVFEDCDFGPQSSGCNRLQSLEEAAPSRPLEVDQASINGAVLFGANRQLEGRRCQRVTQGPETISHNASSLRQSRVPPQTLAVELDSRPARVAEIQTHIQQEDIQIRNNPQPGLLNSTLNNAGPSTDLRRMHPDDSDESSNVDNEDNSNLEYRATPTAVTQRRFSAPSSQLPRSNTMRNTPLSSERRNVNHRKIKDKLRSQTHDITATSNSSTSRK